MKINIFIIKLLLLQANLFAQDTLFEKKRILFERDSTRIELEKRRNGKDSYRKIVLYQGNHKENIITLGIDTSAFTGMGVRDWNTANIDTPLLAKFHYKNLKNNVFYNDSLFSFTAIGSTITRMSQIIFFQCKKEKRQWKVNKIVRYPFYFSDTGSNGCNVFFISEDIAFLDRWHQIGISESFPKGGERHLYYIVILGEDGNYTHFIQEDKTYPPKRPPYIIPPNPKH